MSPAPSSHFAPSLIAALFCLSISGCDQTQWPQTYPITGKVVTQDGQPHTSGIITFTLVSDPQVKSSGAIGSDGSFTLTTNAQAEDGKSKVFEGNAAAGEYHVSIYPYPGSKGGGRSSYTLKQTYTIAAQESNDLSVTMEPVTK